MPATLHITATMVTHAQVNVCAGREQRTYPTVEAFVHWLSDVHTRVLAAGGTLEITTGHGPAAYQHPADLALREAIGDTSAAPCLC